MKPWFAFTATLAALTVLVTSCSQSTTTSPSADIKLDFAIALTGDAAEIGNAGCQGAQFAANSINAGGGLRGGPHNGAHLVVQCIDDQGSPDAAITVANGYVADKNVWSMMGFLTSGEGLAAAKAVERYNLSIIGTNIGGSFLTQQVHNVVPMIPSLPGIGYMWPSFCQQYYGATRLGDLASDFSFTVDFRNGLKAAVAATPGVTLADEVTYAGLTTADYTPYLTKLKSGIDCFLVLATPPFLCKIASQARPLGIKAPIVDFGAGGTSLSCPQAGGSAYIGMVFVDFLPVPFTAGSYLATVNGQFKAKYGKDLDNYSSYAFDSVMVVAHAIEAGAQTREDLLKYIHNVNFVGLSGSLSFGSDLRPLQRQVYLSEATGNTAPERQVVATYQVSGFTAVPVNISSCGQRPSCALNR
jgi:branched-chain amino acid transport system substrate-binding protein